MKTKTEQEILDRFEIIERRFKSVEDRLTLIDIDNKTNRDIIIKLEEIIMNNYIQKQEKAKKR